MFAPQATFDPKPPLILSHLRARAAFTSPSRRPGQSAPCNGRSSLPFAPYDGGRSPGPCLHGWAAFSLLGGTIDHRILGVHHVNETVPCSA
ncbi:DUF2243 domain-containing protein [Methylobacterium sp. DB0501]|nr:DUF2243 domain-containing protein [Methylobacterium sp. DB0501]